MQRRKTSLWVFLAALVVANRCVAAGGVAVLEGIALLLVSVSPRHVRAFSCHPKRRIPLCQPSVPLKNGAAVTCLFATSSSDLKNGGSKPTSDKASSKKSKIGSTTSRGGKKDATQSSKSVSPNVASVASRLKNAATHAAHKARLQEEEAAKKQKETQAMEKSSLSRFSTRLRNLESQSNSRGSGNGNGSSSSMLNGRTATSMSSAGVGSMGGGVTGGTSATTSPTKALGSLSKLTAMIDAQLSRSRQGLTNNVQYQQLQPPRDSMSAVMIHNDRMERRLPNSGGGKSGTEARSTASGTTNTVVAAMPLHGIGGGGIAPLSPPKHVAVVLAKPLMDDQITIEFATRIQRLVRAMLYDNYHPDVICFVEGYGRSSSGSSNAATRNGTATIAIASGYNNNNNGVLVSDCDVGYTYFRHLAASLKINVDNVVFYLQRKSIQSGALDEIATMIQRDCVPVWIQQVSFLPPPSSLSSSSSGRRLVRKLPIQLTLVSSEYHLCILNDIHVRSPGQSPLRSFERWPSVSVDAHGMVATTSGSGSSSTASATIQLETSWTYLYATTVNMQLSMTNVPNNEHDNDEKVVATFAAACYKRSQDLIPVLQNLRGVVADKEFFQRDNYRVLVQARRALVSDMERLYQQQPSLAAVHRVLSPLPPTTDKSLSNEATGSKLPLDVIIEGALLSLGRCLDLVRPAGLLTGIVPSTDFRLAVTVLEQAVSQISVACDPDQPLPPTGWGPLPLLEENYLYSNDGSSVADSIDDE